jgi:hypothetical protein
LHKVGVLTAKASNSQAFTIDLTVIRHVKRTLGRVADEPEFDPRSAKRFLSDEFQGFAVIWGVVGADDENLISSASKQREEHQAQQENCLAPLHTLTST